MRRPACYAAIPGVKNEENRLPIKPTEKLATAENIKKNKKTTKKLAMALKAVVNYSLQTIYVSLLFPSLIFALAPPPKYLKHIIKLIS